jgi:hypothetical protein
MSDECNDCGHPEAKHNAMCLALVTRLGVEGEDICDCPGFVSAPAASRPLTESEKYDRDINPTWRPPAASRPSAEPSEAADTRRALTDFARGHGLDGFTPIAPGPDHPTPSEALAALNLLVPYLHHDRYCTSDRNDGDGPCSCGLGKYLDEARKLVMGGRPAAGSETVADVTRLLAAELPDRGGGHAVQLALAAGFVRRIRAAVPPSPDATTGEA